MMNQTCISPAPRHRRTPLACESSDLAAVRALLDMWAAERVRVRSGLGSTLAAHGRRRSSPPASRPPVGVELSPAAASVSAALAWLLDHAPRQHAAVAGWYVARARYRAAFGERTRRLEEIDARREALGHAPVLPAAPRASAKDRYALREASGRVRTEAEVRRASWQAAVDALARERASCAAPTMPTHASVAKALGFGSRQAFSEALQEGEKAMVRGLLEECG